MKSAFFISFVRHIRFIPKTYSFDYHFFWTKFDLDELDDLDKNTFFFSRNSFNLISYYDDDHIYLGQPTTRKNIEAFMLENEVHEKIKKIELLTNPRILGYTFNPVSFYFIETDESPYIIIEIGNTFGEQKPYLVRTDCKKGDEWIYTTKKNFYISPFASVENTMTFKIRQSNQNLQITIDDFNISGDLEIKTIFNGKRKNWTSLNIFKLMFMYPLLTIRIIISIHYHALRLYLKRIPYFRKNDEIDLQMDLFVLNEKKFKRK